MSRPKPLTSKEAERVGLEHEERGELAAEILKHVIAFEKSPSFNLASKIWLMCQGDKEKCSPEVFTCFFEGIKKQVKSVEIRTEDEKYIEDLQFYNKFLERVESQGESKAKEELAEKGNITVEAIEKRLERLFKKFEERNPSDN